LLAFCAGGANFDNKCLAIAITGRLKRSSLKQGDYAIAFMRRRKFLLCWEKTRDRLARLRDLARSRLLRRVSSREMQQAG